MTDGGDGLTAYIDGGARGNPGPAGFGVHLEDAAGQPIRQFYGYLGVQTNNFAEYAALVAVLDYAVRESIEHLQVFSDSELLVKQMRGIYRVRHPNLIEPWREAQALAKQLPEFSIRHVRRKDNRIADRLANRAMDLRASGAIDNPATNENAVTATKRPPAAPKDDPPETTTEHTTAAPEDAPPDASS